MKESSPWMKLVDERILERLAGGPDASAWEIALDINSTISEERVTERCEVLADAGFVDISEYELARGRTETYFSITTQGSQYLAGEINAELYRPDPGIRPPHATRPGWWAGFS